MNENQSVVKQLIEEVVALAEATRFLATTGRDEFAAVEVVKACNAAIGRTVRALETATMPEVAVRSVPPQMPEPPAPLPSAEITVEGEPCMRLEGVEVIESLDDIFDAE